MRQATHTHTGVFSLSSFLLNLSISREPRPRKEIILLLAGCALQFLVEQRSFENTSNLLRYRSPSDRTNWSPILSELSFHRDNVSPLRFSSWLIVVRTYVCMYMVRSKRRVWIFLVDRTSRLATSDMLTMELSANRLKVGGQSYF